MKCIRDQQTHFVFRVLDRDAKKLLQTPDYTPSSKSAWKRFGRICFYKGKDGLIITEGKYKTSEIQILQEFKEAKSDLLPKKRMKHLRKNTNNESKKTRRLISLNMTIDNIKKFYWPNDTAT